MVNFDVPACTGQVDKNTRVENRDDYLFGNLNAMYLRAQLNKANAINNNRLKI